MRTSLGHDLPDAVLLAVGRRLLHVLHLDTRFRSHLRSTCTDRLFQRLGELLGVVEQPDPARVGCRCHRLRVAHRRERSAHHLVVARQNADDLVTMAVDQVAIGPTISPTLPADLLSCRLEDSERVSGTRESRPGDSECDPRTRESRLEDCTPAGKRKHSPAGILNEKSHS